MGRIVIEVDEKNSKAIIDMGEMEIENALITMFQGAAKTSAEVIKIMSVDEIEKEEFKKEMVESFVDKFERLVKDFLESNNQNID